MSQENVETVQRAIEAWNADDLDAFLAELDADVEWHPAIQPGLEGRATTTEVMTARNRSGGRTAARHGNASPIGPRSSATSASRSSRLGHMDLTARATGIEFSQELGEVFDLRAGKIVRIRDFLTHAEALEAAGLAE